MIDDPTPLCDICGYPDMVGEAEDGHWLTPDWNGETGNHRTCEKAKAEGHCALALANLPHSHFVACECEGHVHTTHDHPSWAHEYAYGPCTRTD